MAKKKFKKIAKRSKAELVRLKASPKPSVIKSDNFFKHLRLKNIRLIDEQSHLEIRGIQLPTKAKIAAGAAVGASPDGTIHVDVTIDVQGRPADASDDSSLVTFHALYQCVYEVTGRKVEEFQEVSDQIGQVGMLIVWPYFREMIHSVTLRMGIPPFIVPMFVPGGKGDNIITMEQVKKSVAK